MLVGAPLSSTTLDTHARADLRHTAAHSSTAALAPMKFDVPVRSIATLVGAELLLVGVGAGVILVARREHQQAP